MTYPLPNNTAGVVAGNHLSKLLQLPITARMCCGIDMKNSARRMFDDYEHISQPVGCCQIQSPLFSFLILTKPLVHHNSGGSTGNQ